MARLVADRVIRTCRAEDVEADLESLWREVSDRTPAARPIMSNLVVFQACEHAGDSDPQAPLQGVPIEAIAERHPSRIIVLMHKNDPDRLQAPVTASVGILLFGSDRERSAVEQITIHCVSAEASLPSIVRRFIFGDRPTSVWWTDDFSQSPPLMALATLGRQFVYDSQQWRDIGAGMQAVVTLLENPHTPDLADVNWRRIAPLRRALEPALRRIPAAPIDRSLRIRVRHGADDESKAWLIIGWLMSWLRQEYGREVSIERERVATHALSIAVSDGDTFVCSADVSESQVVVTEPGTTAPLVAHVPGESVADAVVAELSSLGHDSSLVAAIRAACSLISGV